MRLWWGMMTGQNSVLIGWIPYHRETKNKYVIEMWVNDFDKI